VIEWFLGIFSMKNNFFIEKIETQHISQITQSQITQSQITQSQITQ
jgi:hypothetical protein